MKRKKLLKYQEMVNLMLSNEKSHPYYGTIDAIVEEVGEVSKVLKPFHHPDTTPAEKIEISTGEHLVSELGDVLFNLTLLAARHGILLSDILHYNYDKIKENARLGAIMKFDVSIHDMDFPIDVKNL